jgi:glutamate racemase
VAEKLLDYLNRHPEIEQGLSKNKGRSFYTTDDPERFKSFGSTFLGRKISEVQSIPLPME